MFIVVLRLSDKDYDFWHGIIDREKYGYSDRFRVMAEGFIFLTEQDAQNWIDSNRLYLATYDKFSTYEVRKIDEI